MTSTQKFDQPLQLIIKSSDGSSIDFLQKNSDSEISALVTSRVIVSYEPTQLTTNCHNKSQNENNFPNLSDPNAEFIDGGDLKADVPISDFVIENDVADEERCLVADEFDSHEKSEQCDSPRNDLHSNCVSSVDPIKCQEKQESLFISDKCNGYSSPKVQYLRCETHVGTRPKIGSSSDNPRNFLFDDSSNSNNSTYFTETIDYSESDISLDLSCDSISSDSSTDEKTNLHLKRKEAKVKYLKAQNNTSDIASDDPLLLLQTKVHVFKLPDSVNSNESASNLDKMYSHLSKKVFKKDIDFVHRHENCSYKDAKSDDGSFPFINNLVSGLQAQLNSPTSSLINLNPSSNSKSQSIKSNCFASNLDSESDDEDKSDADKQYLSSNINKKVKSNSMLKQKSHRVTVISSDDQNRDAHGLQMSEDLNQMHLISNKVKENKDRRCKKRKMIGSVDDLTPKRRKIESTEGVEAVSKPNDGEKRSETAKDFSSKDGSTVKKRLFPKDALKRPKNSKNLKKTTQGKKTHLKFVKKFHSTVNKKVLINPEQRTIKVNNAEQQRIERLLQQKARYNEFSVLKENSKRFILDFDDIGNVRVEVNSIFLNDLKAHQIDGIEFLYNSTIENIDKLKQGDKGSGCILAHCMGLGKTFQAIAFVHTILSNSFIREYIKTVLIAVPVNVLKNWVDEFNKWITSKGIKNFEVYEINDETRQQARLGLLRQWKRKGGVLIIGHQLLANLSNLNSKCKFITLHSELLKKYFLNPGPDLLIIDEGHLLKNSSNQLYKCVKCMKSKRKIFLTGTPLQNNLDEYYTLINILKPRILGFKKYFKAQFQNVIERGQKASSTDEEFRLMKEKESILHKSVRGIIQRFDNDTLRPFVPPKTEFALYIKPTRIIAKMYNFFMDHVQEKRQLIHSQYLRFLFNHPSVYYLQDAKKAEEANTLLEYTSLEKDWYKQFVDDEDWNDIRLSCKFVMLFKILSQCIYVGDKLVVVSQSIATLDLITKLLEPFAKVFGDQLNWECGKSFFRIDGTIFGPERQKQIEMFNDPKNKEARLFLLSTKAGGVGINLTGANRCIIFDVSWNPSDDIQAICRVYRMGQTKPVYVYRFITKDTMEEQIFRKQVLKLGMAIRVIDKQQVKRASSTCEPNEFYDIRPKDEYQISLSGVPKDRLLADLLHSGNKEVLECTELDSLLEKKPEEELTEEERQVAWTEYQKKREAEMKTAQEIREIEVNRELSLAGKCNSFNSLPDVTASTSQSTEETAKVLEKGLIPSSTGFGQLNLNQPSTADQEECEIEIIDNPITSQERPEIEIVKESLFKDGKKTKKTTSIPQKVQSSSSLLSTSVHLPIPLSSTKSDSRPSSKTAQVSTSNTCVAQSKRSMSGSQLLSENLIPSTSRSQISSPNTNDESKQLLLSKFDVVYFLSPTAVMVKMYNFFLDQVHKDKSHFLSHMNYLRQCVNHPAIYHRNIPAQIDRNSFIKGTFLKTNWYEQFVQSSDCIKIDLSAKFIELFKILQKCLHFKFRRLVIVIYSIETLNFVELMLRLNSESKLRFNNRPFDWQPDINCFRIDEYSDKQDQIDKIKHFNSENQQVKLLLLGTDNIAANSIDANHVIFFDFPLDLHVICSILKVWFTPWLKSPRTTRIHRFVTKDTMEEPILMQQLFRIKIKKEIFNRPQKDLIPVSYEPGEFYNKRLNDVYPHTPTKIQSSNSMMDKLFDGQSETDFSSSFSGAPEVDSQLQKTTEPNKWTFPASTQFETSFFNINVNHVRNSRIINEYLNQPTSRVNPEPSIGYLPPRVVDAQSPSGKLRGQNEPKKPTNPKQKTGISKVKTNSKTWKYTHRLDLSQIQLPCEITFKVLRGLELLNQLEIANFLQSIYRLKGFDQDKFLRYKLENDYLKVQVADRSTKSKLFEHFKGFKENYSQRIFLKPIEHRTRQPIIKFYTKSKIFQLDLRNNHWSIENMKRWNNWNHSWTVSVQCLTEFKEGQKVSLIVDSNVRDAIDRGNGKISLGDHEVSIEDALGLFQCYKCFDYDRHNLSECSRRCCFCSDQHYYKTCRFKNDSKNWFCHFCSVKGHSAFSINCPALIDQLRPQLKTIDYNYNFIYFGKCRLDDNGTINT